MSEIDEVVDAVNRNSAKVLGLSDKVALSIEATNDLSETVIKLIVRYKALEARVAKLERRRLPWWKRF